jgi:hypothetical protein
MLSISQAAKLARYRESTSGFINGKAGLNSFLVQFCQLSGDENAAHMGMGLGRWISPDRVVGVRRWKWVGH